MVCEKERDGRTRFFGRENIQQKGKVQPFSLAVSSLYFLPLVGHPDLLIRKILMRVVGLLTMMIMKRISESIFFQSKRFKACKLKDEKEVTNLNLLHILLK